MADEMKSLFVEGCALDEAGRRDLDAVPLCTCMVDRLENEITLVDLLMLSLVGLDPDVGLDPVTGIPTDLAPELVEIVVDVSVSCVLSL